MANMPVCANFRERKCERSDIVLLKETEEIRHFYCRTCKSDYIETRRKIKHQAAHELKQERIAKATARERKLVFGRYYGGATNANS